jgi:transposase
LYHSVIHQVSIKANPKQVIKPTSSRTVGPVKALIHNGAMSAIQHSPEIRQYYLRKTSEGKNEMLVVNNVCNKLIHRVFSCVHRKEKYKDFYMPLVA